MATEKEYKELVKALSGECERLHKENEELKTLEQEPCEDAISREDVMDWLENATYEDVCEAIGTNLDFLPSVTPSRPIGHWIETEYHRWRCSVCREKGMSEWDNIHADRTNFCPNCGAEMGSEG